MTKANKGKWSNNPAFNWARRNFAPVAALTILWIVLSVFTDTFFTQKNLISVLSQISVNGFIAIGITCVLIAGGIDLSVGSVVAAAGVVAVRLANSGFPVIICVLVALTFGAAIGLFNGYVISHTNLPPFIVTLSVQIIVRGLSYVFTGGQPAQCTNDGFNFLGTGKILGIPVPILLIIATFIIVFIIINRTTFGRHMYAVGGNREAARYAGVDTKKIQMKVFMISGMMAAMAGIVLAARLYSGQPAVGEGFERDAIAASVLGGTSFNGGIGTLGGTAIGVLIIGVLNNGMNLLRISSYWQFVVKGTVILGAVYIDFIKESRTLK